MAQTQQNPAYTAPDVAQQPSYPRPAAPQAPSHSQPFPPSQQYARPPPSAVDTPLQPAYGNNVKPASQRVIVEASRPEHGEELHHNRHHDEPKRRHEHGHGHEHEHEHEHHSTHAEGKSKHHDRNAALGVGGGAAIGTAFLPGVGTAAGALIGGYGAHKREMKKKYGDEGKY